MGSPRETGDREVASTRRARERAAREPCALGRAVLMVYAIVFVVVLVAVLIVVFLARQP